MSSILELNFDDEPAEKTSTYIECEFEQRTKEWFIDRNAIPTGTGFAKIITTKGKASTQAGKYMRSLLADWLAGEPADESDWTDRNKYIQNGIEQEPEARDLYEFITGSKVREINFCFLNDKKEVGVSPDGGVTEKGCKDEKGGVEIKCVKGETLVDYRLADKVPTTYFQQMQGQMWVMGWEWCDFFAYHPKCGHFKKRMFRDDEFIENLEKAVEAFNIEMKLKQEILSK